MCICENKDFPCGRLGKNPPTNAGDRGFNPWSGKILRAEGQLNPWDPTTEPVS